MSKVKLMWVENIWINMLYVMQNDEKLNDIHIDIVNLHWIVVWRAFTMNHQRSIMWNHHFCDIIGSNLWLGFIFLLQKVTYNLCFIKKYKLDTGIFIYDGYFDSFAFDWWKTFTDCALFNAFVKNNIALYKSWFISYSQL